MSRKNWRTVQPCDLRDAMDLCLQYAKAKHNRSVDTVSELMGVNKWTLYKWIAETDMPARLIKPFEHACGTDFVSRWMVVSSGKLVIDIPKGKKCGADDIQALQANYHDTVGKLMRFYADLSDVDDTLAAIQSTLEQTSWHRGNVEKYRQPELPFDEE